MCGIIGYIGTTNCSNILLNGLKALEYRGYDSSGVAIINNKTLHIRKLQGKLQALVDSINSEPILGKIGIGHTRWATHGQPTNENSHPHFNTSKSIAVVHNGIIENYLQLKEELIKEGYKFVSETDTEVIAHLLDKYLLLNNNLLKAFQNVLSVVKGSYALVAISTSHNTIVASSKDSPLIVGILKDGYMLASDTLAMGEYTSNFIKLNNYDCVEININECNFFNQQGQPIAKETFSILEASRSLSKDGYEHFMLKEICEQPKKIVDTIMANYVNGNLLPSFNIATDNIKNIYFIACGTSYYSSLIGANIINQFSKINCYNYIASEFKTSNIKINKDDLVIFVSQSGETADTIMAIKYIKDNFKCSTVAILNVLGSSISHLVDNVIYTKAMAEIAVASTKAYTTQLIIYIMLAIKLSKQNFSNFNDVVKDVADIINNMLQNNLSSKLNSIVEYIVKFNSIFFLGRGLDYYTTLEGALKLKEVSYLHSESFPAGELKHGSIALITKGTPVIFVITQKDLISKSVSNIAEVKSRGAYVIVITTSDIIKAYKLDQLCDIFIEIENTKDYLMPIISVVPLQMLAYRTAVYLNYDVDKPRNLAKSVTVE